jgi:hypothetical protein
MVPREINKFGALSPEEAYDAGYRRKSDRKAQFPWNSDMEDVISLGKLEAIELLHKKFRKYEGKYTLE